MRAYLPFNFFRGAITTRRAPFDIRFKVRRKIPMARMTGGQALLKSLQKHGVGSKQFIEKVKEKLGFRALGRKVNGFEKISL